VWLKSSPRNLPEGTTFDLSLQRLFQRLQHHPRKSDSLIDFKNAITFNGTTPRNYHPPKVVPREDVRNKHSLKDNCKTGSSKNRYDNQVSLEKKILHTLSVDLEIVRLQFMERDDPLVELPVLMLGRKKDEVQHQNCSSDEGFVGDEDQTRGLVTLADCCKICEVEHQQYEACGAESHEEK
jgi:hypothetical protein